MASAYSCPLRLMVAPLSALAVVACAPAEEGGSAEVEPPAANESSGDASDAPISNDMAMAETGWLTVGEDGAVYTTFLDSGGTYRDFRNGALEQSGTWERREDGRLCFLPEGASASDACWRIGKLEDDGSMRVTNGDDRTIEVKRVSYRAPEAAEADAEAVAQDAEAS